MIFFILILAQQLEFSSSFTQNYFALIHHA